MKYPTARIIIMCKAPLPGEVKTRLIPALGADDACRLHELLATRIIETVLLSDLCPLTIWCSPDINHIFFKSYAQRATLKLQAGRDIGERMFHAALHELDNDGVDRVLIVGTDTPSVDAAYLDNALSRLNDQEAVIGPAEDGGYVLLGLKRAESLLFEGMTWSTDKVFDETVSRLDTTGWNWVSLPCLWDVDEPEDLQRIPDYLTDLN